MISQGRLRRELGLGADRESELAGIRLQVMDLWEQATGRPWRRQVGRVDAFDFPEPTRRTLMLRLTPVSSITLVEEHEGTSGATWSTLDTDDWMQTSERGVEKLSGYWARRIRVTYTGGYDDDTCPADVQQALVLQARFSLSRFSGDKLHTRSQNFEGGAGVFEEGYLHPFFMQLAKARCRKATV